MLAIPQHRIATFICLNTNMVARHRCQSSHQHLIHASSTQLVACDVQRLECLQDFIPATLTAYLASCGVDTQAVSASHPHSIATFVCLPNMVMRHQCPPQHQAIYVGSDS